MTATKKKIRVLFLLIAVFAVFFQSCGDRKDEDSLYNKMMTLLGFDMNDYENEAVIRFPDKNGEAVAEIKEIISILVYDSAEIYPFENTRDAAANNSDAILNYMLRTSYSAYSGNAELLSEAVEAYPQYNITTLIPKKDFESCVYRFFGGDSSVQHSSSVRFTYLPKVSAYTTTGQPASLDIKIDITKCTETTHTYRVEFTLTDKEGDTASYHAMIMKRDDGTEYVKFLRLAQTVE